MRPSPSGPSTGTGAGTSCRSSGSFERRRREDLAAGLRAGCQPVSELLQLDEYGHAPVGEERPPRRTTARARAARRRSVHLRGLDRVHPVRPTPAQVEAELVALAVVERAALEDVGPDEPGHQARGAVEERGSVNRE